jgi:endonuclease YncB( thermonuclease family)
MRIIDPPSGWQYGFPKPIPNDVKNVNEWLVKEGYPQKLIDDLGEHFYCRYWERDDDEDLSKI